MGVSLNTNSFRNRAALACKGLPLPDDVEEGAVKKVVEKAKTLSDALKELPLEAIHPWKREHFELWEALESLEAK